MSTYFSLIIPCYNEEEVITKAYNQITEDLKILNGNNYELETAEKDLIELFKPKYNKQGVTLEYQYSDAAYLIVKIIYLSLPVELFCNDFNYQGKVIF